MSISPQRLAELAAMRDEDIDFSDIPEQGEEFFRNARLVMPPDDNKKPISIRVDADVLEWFKAQGAGHLTRMNAVLRAYMLAARSEGAGGAGGG